MLALVYVCERTFRWSRQSPLHVARVSHTFCVQRREAELGHTYYDRTGKPVAYLDDDEVHIYAFDGRPLAYLSGEHVYDFGGKFVAWNSDGWLRDTDGHALLSTDHSQGGPTKPFNQFEPFKGFKQFLPFKGFEEFAPFKPFDSHNWSGRSFW
jgi:hypothetical protein